MDRQTYARWHDHPLRALLKRAAAGDHIYPDELDDLNLPANLKAATRQAIDKAKKLDSMKVDQLSAELFQALPDHHETRAQREARRAQVGDADALANRRAQDEARAEMANRIFTDGGVH